MATTVQINAICDAILAAFNSDAALWAAFLTRSKLETELAAIESDLRNKQVEAFDEAALNAAEISVLDAAKAAKLAEIDAL